MKVDSDTLGIMLPQGRCRAQVAGHGPITSRRQLVSVEGAFKEKHPRLRHPAEAGCQSIDAWNRQPTKTNGRSEITGAPGFPGFLRLHEGSPSSES